MAADLFIFSEVLNPDLNLRLVIPHGWTVESRLYDTQGCLFNNVWSSPDPKYLFVNLSVIIYPLGTSSQNEFFEKHVELYNATDNMQVLASEKFTNDQQIEFESIKVRSTQSGVTTIGLVTFHVDGKLCYILQFVAPEKLYDVLESLRATFFNGFMIKKPEGLFLPERPEAGTQDALEGWVFPANAMEYGDRKIPTLVYVNERFGFSFIVPSESSFTRIDAGGLWCYQVNLPFRYNDRQAVLIVQVLNGTQETSAMLLDRIERMRLKENHGLRVKRVSLMGKYGSLEFLQYKCEHRNNEIQCHVWTHARNERAFALELIMPNGTVEHADTVSQFICNGFRVYELPEKTSTGLP